MISKIKLYLKKRNLRKRRLGNFWCNRHWKMIEDSLIDEKPIDPSVAAVGITIALYLKDVNPELARIRACCYLDAISQKEKLLVGIFERSRVENFATWEKNQTLPSITTN